jgi:hypothetical protein
MSDPEMDAPATRRDLHDALDTWTGALNARVDNRFDVVTARIDAVNARIDHVAIAITHDIVTQVKALLKVLEDRLMGELRHQATGSARELEDRLVVIDEPYRDLPRRVTKLEAKVFGPPPKRRRRAAR